jgi:hypothetical protein
MAESTKAMREAVDENECETAEELLAELSANARAYRGRRSFWAFRGHGNDHDYKLIPAALRSQRTNPIRLGYTFDVKVGPLGTKAEQVQAEYDLLREYYWSVDSRGLPIPEDGQFLRTPEGWRPSRGTMKEQPWPLAEIRSFMALAQQYGIPTRLLDWTDRPLIAAYFAAREAAQGLKENRIQKNGQPVTHLAVWCIDIDWVIYEGWPSIAGETPNVLVITAPRASNPNLHAQGGIFVAEAVDPNDPDQVLRPEPLNEILSRRWGRTGSSDPVMRHLTMPVAEAGKLLRLLHEESVCAATVYPGFKGVADSMNERRFWDKAERLSYWLPK